MTEDSRCPITVVTGFLGSGKTTLLANVLRRRRLHLLQHAG